MYVFYFDDLLLPQAPAKMKIKINNRNSSIELINDGEVNLLKSPGLTDISFEATIPGVRYPWAEYHYTDFWHPSNFLNQFEKLKLQRSPFDFVVARKWVDGTGLSFRTDMRVSLEFYEIIEDAENGKDIVVDFELKQYKSFGSKQITIDTAKKTAETTTPREEPKTETTDYTVVSGDTLWGIAKRFLGSGEKRKEIYDLNKDIIEAEAKKHGKESSSSGHWIYPGTKLKIPQIKIAALAGGALGQSLKGPANRPDALPGSSMVGQILKGR